jgi:2-polyprenyl-3-methyl-5-hydroxy-6-metoxy-1,4-benzoquinol methylase
MTDLVKPTLTFMGSLGRCAPLMSKDEVESAYRIVEWLGLPSHHDRQKNWDTLKCLYYLLQEIGPQERILDAGASGKSAILRWLSRLKFGQLHACDIRAKNDQPYKEHNITFTVQDLTKTNYPDGHFGAVTCISVIEHNVPLQRFLTEMHRVIRPEGLLLISTDYWSEPIDCSGIYPYGESMGEMKVFQAAEISQFVKTAESSGFRLCSPMDLRTREKAIRWDRVNREYTFLFMAFRKEVPGLT